MTAKVDGFFTMDGFTTEEPTMHLRFVAGRLQQLFSVKNYEDGKLVSAGGSWRDVPDATPATRPAPAAEGTE